MKLRNILAIVLAVLCMALLAGSDEQSKAGGGRSQGVVCGR